MPFVIVHMWTGRTVDQKRRLLAAITDAMVEHAGAKPDHLHVVVQEYERENWARAGVLSADTSGAYTVEPATREAAEPEPTTGSLHHLLLECRDLDASVRFYTRVVGIRIRKEDVHRDGRRLVLSHNGIGLTTLADDTPGNVDHLAFPVTSVAEAVERGRSAGVEPIRGPGPGPYGHTVYLLDPDGNEVELIEMTGEITAT